MFNTRRDCPTMALRVASKRSLFEYWQLKLSNGNLLYLLYPGNLNINVLNIRAYFVQWAPMSTFKPQKYLGDHYSLEKVGFQVPIIFSVSQWALMRPFESQWAFLSAKELISAFRALSKAFRTSENSLRIFFSEKVKSICLCTPPGE